MQLIAVSHPPSSTQLVHSTPRPCCLSSGLLGQITEPPEDPYLLPPLLPDDEVEPELPPYPDEYWAPLGAV